MNRSSDCSRPYLLWDQATLSPGAGRTWKSKGSQNLGLGSEVAHFLHEHAKAALVMPLMRTLSQAQRTQVINYLSEDRSIRPGYRIPLRFFARPRPARRGGADPANGAAFDFCPVQCVT